MLISKIKTVHYAKVAKLAYAGDLKSPSRNTVRVQVPSFAPYHASIRGRNSPYACHAEKSRPLTANQNASMSVLYDCEVNAHVYE